MPFIGYSIYSLIAEKYYLSNYKLLFASIDAGLVSLVAIVVTIVYLRGEFMVPKVYQKYIIEGISNYTLPALSEPAEEQPEDDDLEDGLHRSNSTGNINK